MSRITEIQHRQQRRLQVVELLAQLEKTDPEFLAELVGSVNGSAAGRTRVAVSDTGFEKARSYLEANGNVWTETTDLRGGSGLTKAQLAHVLRKSHADRFEERPHPTHRKKLQWRLKTA